MNTKLLAVAAFAAMGLTATSALATQTTVTSGGETITIDATATAFSSTLTGGLGFKMIDDFDSVADTTGYSFSGTQTFTGTQGNAAAPLGDDTHYQGVEVGTPFVVTDTSGYLTAISFYMGSPDGNTDGTGSPQNNVTLQINGSPTTIMLHGPDIWGGPSVNPGNGAQNTGFLITYHFTPNFVHSVSFIQTGSPAFEIDNISGISVPEPASWALMIGGFGLAGATIRAKRRQAAAA